MEKIKLTKRECVGGGYVDKFWNKKTGEFGYQLSTKADYENLATGNIKPICTLENPEEWMWSNSYGGPFTVDTQDFALSVGEYAIVGEDYWVAETNDKGFTVSKYSQEEFNNIYGNSI